MASVKTIAVTGGNRGIGLEICRQLAASGHHVILCSRDLEKGMAAAKGLAGKVSVRQLDMGSEASITEFASKLASEVPQLDVLINNAGILPGKGNTTQVTMREMRAVFDPNFFGPFHLSQALLPLLRKSGEGRIVNVSSEMGALDSLTGGYASYRLSKAALNAMTVLMAGDLSSEGIKVNAMCPGWVRTDMGGAGAYRSVAQGADTAVWLATAEKVPTGKFFSDRKERSW